MTNINGDFHTDSNAFLGTDNRGLNYGDALFETIRVVRGKVLFWEDHYFRLMASMRILRMEIPMNFTMEFLEEQILETIKMGDLISATVRAKLLVYRDSDGLYLPREHDIGYLISVAKLDSEFYTISDIKDYSVDLYKDHYVISGLLSTLKTTNRILNVIASIYASENGWHNCLLLNENKSIVEALNGNLFIVNGKTLRTPSLNTGCINGIMRKQIIGILNEIDVYELVEETISPFELQKADEIFITNVISGIISVGSYRKKTYSNTVAKDLLGKLNTRIRVG